jgi:hypothetical protein
MDEAAGSAPQPLGRARFAPAVKAALTSFAGAKRAAAFGIVLLPMLGLFYNPYAMILVALAIVHFVRRRPDTYWLFIIMMGGVVGALAYILVEVIPDLGLLRGTFEVFPRRNRIKHLQFAILDNPSAGNYEELGDLYLDDKQFTRARESLDRVIAMRTDSVDPFYRRALAEIALNDFAAATADLEEVIRRDPKYDYHRAAGLLAHSLGKVGRRDEAHRLFADVTQISTLSETQYLYASFLAAEGQPAEARVWAQRILAKKPTMPAYIRRRERPWFRKANALLRRLRLTGAATASQPR